MAHDSPVIAGYIFRNNLHSLFLLTVMASLLALIGYLLAELQGLIGLLIAGGVILVNSPRFSAKRILNICSAYPLSHSDFPELMLKIEKLSRAAGLENTPHIYCCDQNVMNSFTMKVENNHAIVVSSKLIQDLNYSEILAVIAHEIAHIYQDDIYVMLLADRLSQFTQVLTAIGLILLALAPILSLQNINVPWFVIMSLLFAHFITGLLQLTLSRIREFNADVIAVQLTNNVDAMVSALKKIETCHADLLVHVFAGNAHSIKPPLLRTHPSTQERVRCLLGLDMLTRSGHVRQDVS